jgi:hypothetical protein
MKYCSNKYLETIPYTFQYSIYTYNVRKKENKKEILAKDANDTQKTTH